MNLLLGHLVGDYLLQNKWMAMNKSASTLKCVVHCLLYTLAVLAFTKFSPLWAVIVFASHFVIDRWSIADKWLDLIHGRSLRDFMEDGMSNIPFEQRQYCKFWNYYNLRGSFTAIVYTVADNTMHLCIMWGFWCWLN